MVISSVKDYLEHMADFDGFAGGFERFVLAHGRAFDKIGDASAYKPEYTTVKECYRNAYQLTQKSKGRLVYCEGYALSIIPVLHAWCWNPEADEVIDPTWTGGNASYYGVPFDMDYVTETILERGMYGVIDNLENRFALVKRPERFNFKFKK